MEITNVLTLFNRKMTLKLSQCHLYSHSVYHIQDHILEDCMVHCSYNRHMNPSVHP